MVKIYKPTETTNVGKPWGFSGVPNDGRSMPIDTDGNYYVRRAYRSIAEAVQVLPVLNEGGTITRNREGGYPIIINSTGTYNASTGTITGGKYEIYRWTKGLESTDTDIEPWTDLSDYVTSEQLTEAIDSLSASIVDLLGADGTYTTTDTGQTRITIPHTLSAKPRRYDINPNNQNAGNLSISWKDADDTNLYAYLGFSQNDSASLRYVWWASQPGEPPTPGENNYADGYVTSGYVN